MFILRIIRYMKGYLQFSASGNFVERFINLMARKQISIWGTKKKGDCLYSYARAKDYEDILKIAEQTGTVVQIEKEIGIPYNKKKYRKRKGILVGVIFFVLFMLVMSNFVWSIDISGNENVDQQQILQALENSGVKVGTYIKGIDFDIMQQKVMLQLDDVSWLGYSMDGTRLSIEIREGIKAPELIGKNEPCNVIAKKTGLITKLSVYDGYPEVQVGDSVVEGELIVNSIITTKKGNSVNHARAEVLALIEETIEFPVVMDQVISEYTGNTIQKYFIEFFDKKVPFSFKKVEYGLFDTQTDKNQAELFGVSLPIFYGKDIYKEYIDVDISYTEEQAKADAFLQREEYVEKYLSSATIISDEATSRIEDGTYILQVNFVYEEDIGLEQPLIIDESVLKQQ